MRTSENRFTASSFCLSVYRSRPSANTRRAMTGSIFWRTFVTSSTNRGGASSDEGMKVGDAFTSASIAVLASA